MRKKTITNASEYWMLTYKTSKNEAKEKKEKHVSEIRENLTKPYSATEISSK